jgi:hypothetical protein
MPLPVLTLDASILISKAASSTLFDLYVNLAFHFSKVPSMGTEAFTANLILLFIGVVLKTGMFEGACVWLVDATARATTIRKIFRMLRSLFYHYFFVNAGGYSAHRRMTRNIARDFIGVVARV